MDKTEELLPTQADRNFAADYLRARGKITDRDHERICQGLWDETGDVLDVTRHRLQSSARGGEMERLREALERIAAPIEGVPVGDPWSFYRDLQEVARAALASPPASNAAADDDGLEDEIAEAITDSLDMDWSSSIGARHVMGLLRKKGIVA